MGGALDLAEARILEQLISFDEALERKNTEIDRLRGDMALMQVTSRTFCIIKVYWILWVRWILSVVWEVILSSRTDS